MHRRKTLNNNKIPIGFPIRPTRMRWVRACACVAFAACLGCIAQDSRPPTPINQAPDANTQVQQHEKMTKTEKSQAANEERRKQIAGDSNQLLTLAIALKAEVDKTTKDTLSLNVIRKADEIEKLAHNVKEKMKLTVGPG